MFLEKTKQRNPRLLEKALELHAAGAIRPDTWVIDLDAVLHNASLILKTASQHSIKLYYMTKQIGRNPLIAQELEKLGYEGAVAVDYKEAEVIVNTRLRLGHVGHLVQIPTSEIPQIVNAKPQIITLYSLEKAKQIALFAQKMGLKQPVMLRIRAEDSPTYPGQEAGFLLSELRTLLCEIDKIEALCFAGLTAFPCFLYDEDKRDIIPTANVKLLQEAVRILSEYQALPRSLQINMPSATCVRTLPLIAAAGGTHAEPGHGLTGTTPLHAFTDQPEIPAMVYVSEVSHHWGMDSMLYGGGFYRRGHLLKALINDKITDIVPPDLSAIDYHFKVNGHFPVGAPALMAFRAQAFVTRSDIAVVSGIQSASKSIELRGIYDPLGYVIKRG